MVNTGPVRRELAIAAPLDAVWEALTDPEELSTWFGAEADVDLRPGGAVRFRWADGTERRGVVVELDPPRMLAFRWRELRSTPDGLDVGEATVVMLTLETEGDRTRIAVTESHGVLGSDPPLAMAERS